MLTRRLNGILRLRNSAAGLAVHTVVVEHTVVEEHIVVEEHTVAVEDPPSSAVGHCQNPGRTNGRGADGSGSIFQT